jgi:hypothetical protein
LLNLCLFFFFFFFFFLIYIFSSSISFLCELITWHMDTYTAAEQHVDNHGRVGVHQGAEAEGGEAEPGDRLRAGRAETQVIIILSHGIYNLISLLLFGAPASMQFVHMPITNQSMEFGGFRQ